MRHTHADGRYCERCYGTDPAFTAGKWIARIVMVVFALLVAQWLIFG